MSREKRALISEGQIIPVVLISAAKTRFVFTAAEIITLATEIDMMSVRLSLYLTFGRPRDGIPRLVGYFAAKFRRPRRTCRTYLTNPSIKVSFQAVPLDYPSSTSKLENLTPIKGISREGCSRVCYSVATWISRYAISWQLHWYPILEVN